MPPTTATIPTTNKMIMPMEIALYVLGPNHGLMSSMCATVCVCVCVCAGRNKVSHMKHLS